MRFFALRRFASLLPLPALFAASSALAQGEAQQLPPSTAPTAQPGAPSVQTPVALPMPNVTDPMLVPVPRAQKEIATWQEALDLLKSRSTDLRIAVDQVQTALGLEREALAGTLPSITAGGSFTENLITKRIQNSAPVITDINGNVYGVGANGTTGFFNPNSGQGTSPTAGPLTVGSIPVNSYTQLPAQNYWGVSLNVTQPILALRTWHQMGTSAAFTRAQRLSIEDLKRTLALGAANAIVGVVTAERVAQLNRSGLQQSLERLDLTVRKQRLGAATGLDVVRAQQDVESARTTLVTGDESLRKSRESLGIALGIPTEVGVVHDLKIDGLERDAVAQCRTASLEKRADILALKEKLHVAERNIDDVWLQFAPTVNAQSNVADTSQAIYASQSVTWNIVGTLSIPIWDGGFRYGELRDMRAQADVARQNLELSRRQALIQIEQAQRGVTVAADTLKVADRARALAVQNDTLTQAAYREGQLTSLDLVTAAATRRQAEIQYALDEFNLVQARVGALLALATCDW
ncbi:MAG TPA: TolC family protein [Polyangiaceae bacterium]|jgi:outer membrane protein TolC